MHRYHRYFPVVLVLSLLAATSATAQPVLIETTSARSYGMGRSGVGDDTDPLNALQNPALLSSLTGIFASGNVKPDLGYSGDNNKAWTGMLAGGTRWPSGDHNAFGVGVAAVYSTFVFGDEFGNEPGYQERYAGGLAAVRYTIREKTAVSAGVGVKSFDAKRNWPIVWQPNPPPATEADAVLFDAGLHVSTRLRTRDGVSVRPALGVSYSNFGAKIEDNSGDEYDPPTEFRFGFSVRVASAAGRGGANGKWQKPPAWSVVFNSDVVDGSGDSDGRLSAGAELSVHDIGFLRLGMDAESEVELLSFGLGVGYNAGRVRFRVDYARLPAWRMDEETPSPLDHFGLSFGYDWE